jgi:glycerol uptake facilitator protein
VYAYGNISGAHLNPAISLGYALSGAISWAKAATYAGIQLLASLVAVVILRLIVGGDGVGRFGAFWLGNTGVFAGLLTELVLTFILMTAVLNVAVRGKATGHAGAVIGMTVAGCLLAGGLITGASMNPARSIGPAIMNLFSANTLPERATDIIVSQVAYIAGPVGGALLAALVDRILNPSDSA